MSRTLRDPGKVPRGILYRWPNPVETSLRHHLPPTKRPFLLQANDFCSDSLRFLGRLRR